MGQTPSKDEMLYKKAKYCDVDGTRELFAAGADLEWVDKKGLTPLIATCTKAWLYRSTRTLIELGANVNAYRRGHQAGTPLHHAAREGLEKTVKLLLSNGADPLLMNDDRQTPLELAREKGKCDVVRTIESHLSLFSGWMLMREQKRWVVVLPSTSRNPSDSFQLELAIYHGLQDSRPYWVITPCKVNIEQKHNESGSLAAIIIGTMRGSEKQSDMELKRHIELSPAVEGDRQQVQLFCTAFVGIQESARLFSTNPICPHDPQISAPPEPEDVELAMAIKASLQSSNPVMSNFNGYSNNDASASTSSNPIVSKPSASIRSTPKESLPKLPTQKASSSGNPLQNNSILPYRSRDQTSASLVIVDDQTIYSSTIGPSSPNPVIERKEDKWGAPSSLHQGQPIKWMTREASSVRSRTRIEIENGSSHSGKPTVSASASALQRLKPNHTTHAASTTEDSSQLEGNSILDFRSDDLAVDISPIKYSPCVICFDCSPEAACVPCGHVAGCISCLNKIQAKKWGCPVCRAKIDHVVKLYRV